MVERVMSFKFYGRTAVLLTTTAIWTFIFSGPMLHGAQIPAVAMAGAASEPAAVRDAESYKKLGDEFIAKDEVRPAADAYEHALSLDRGRFTTDERIRMAIYISWDDRLKQAIRELQFVLEKDPSNQAARVHLARVYSWDGQLERAVSVANGILAEIPDHKESLLVKADALEWGDRFNEAIPIYERIIERDGDFDAEIGLTSALFYKGDRAGAQRRVKTLTASDPRQKRQLQKLSDAIDSETRPRASVGYNFYSDSDHNQHSRYAGRYGFAIANQDVEVNVGRTDSDGGTRSEDVSFQVDFNAPGPVGLAVGLGVTRLHAGTTAQFPTGLLRLHGRLGRTTLSGTASSEILTETSALIGNHVRKIGAGVDLSQRINLRWTVGGAYGHSRFSDSNYANDAQLRTEYAVSIAPRIALGYQVRFLDFDRQSGHGFFDPDNLVSHRLSGSISLERRKFFTFLQVYGGHQSFTRNAFATSEWVRGGKASFGFKASSKLTLELNAVGGDFGTGWISGFKYFTVGSKVSYRF
jgi:tetratricopeptide (TPR) repeat protein